MITIVVPALAFMQGAMMESVTANLGRGALR